MIAQREQDDKLFNGPFMNESIIDGEIEYQKNLKNEHYKKLNDRIFQERHVKIIERQKK